MMSRDTYTRMQDDMEIGVKSRLPLIINLLRTFPQGITLTIFPNPCRHGRGVKSTTFFMNELRKARRKTTTIFIKLCTRTDQHSYWNVYGGPALSIDLSFQVLSSSNFKYQNQL